MNYIEASSVENKDSELTLRNEIPKSNFDSSGKFGSESSVKNDMPIADRCLMVKINPPKKDIINQHKQPTSPGKVTWTKTHFIIAIDSGAEMKRKWGQVTVGIKNWLQTLSDKNAFVTIFTYDTNLHMGSICKTPSESISIIEKEIEVNGEEKVLLETAIKGFETILESPEAENVIGNDWLNYGVILTCEDSPYPQDAVSLFVEYKNSRLINFFFNGMSQIARTFEMTRLATALEGVHYSIKKTADLGRAITEGLERDPASRS